jgi:hypothetical protein
MASNSTLGPQHLSTNAHSPSWKDWILKGRPDAIEANYHARFLTAETVAQTTGIGFPKHHFTSKSRMRQLVGALQSR